MSKLRFLLRKYMPLGFKENSIYAQLPAMVTFLKQYERAQFESKEEFEEKLKEFKDYCIINKIPLSSDKKLRQGLLLEKVEEMPELYNVVAINQGPYGKCYFGSLGTQENLTRYFQSIGQIKPQTNING